MRRLGPAVLVAAVLAFCAFGPMGLASPRIHTWNWYHYYLGAKYFRELGYTGLYEQTLVAQREEHGPLARMSSIRNLATYQVVQTRNLRLRRSPAFSHRRWSAFKRDVDALVPRLPVDKWHQVLLDRGYNGTPAWDAGMLLVTRLVDLRSPVHLHLVKWIDVLGLLVVVIAVGRTFGWWRATALTAAFLFFPPNPARLLGGTVKYDWMYALVLVPVLLRRGRPGLAGAFLGVAACMRVFPAVFLAPFLVRGGLAALRERRLPAREGRLVAGFALAAVVGLGAGALPAGGMERWRAFVPEIELHNGEMRFGNGRVGLDHLFTADLGGGHGADRRANLSAQRWLSRGCAALLLGLFLLAVRRGDDVDAFVLGSTVLFALTVASHYYWSVLALWTLAGRGRRRLVGGTVALLPAALWWAWSLVEQDDYRRWLVMDACLLLLFVATLAYSVVADMRAGPQSRASHDPSAAA